MSYFLGVDAGGTKTEFLLGDETNLLSRVKTGSIKRMRVSSEEAEANLRAAVRELELQSGVQLSRVEHCRIGAAGNTVPLVTDWLKQHFPLYCGGELSIVNDVVIALDAAFEGGRGILVLAGTGSNFAARAEDGTIVTAGGWGPNLADEGSGNLLGLHALRKAFAAIDQERPTSLIDEACAFWKLNGVNDLVAFANNIPAPDFSRFAPLVAASAERGDAVALEAIEEQAALMANLVFLLIEKLRRIEAGRSLPALSVAYTGSVITNVAPLRTAFQATLKAHHPEVALNEQPADPPWGALWGARNAWVPCK